MVGGFGLLSRSGFSAAFAGEEVLLGEAGGGAKSGASEFGDFGGFRAVESV